MGGSVSNKRCVWCHLPLPTKCPSEFFCSEVCQRSWTSDRVGAEFADDPMTLNLYHILTMGDR